MRSLTLAALLLIPATSLAAEEQAPRIHNHASGFLRFWQEHKERPLPEQIAGFKTEVAAKLPEFYNYKFANWPDPDEALGKQLTAFPKIAEAFARKNATIERELAENLRTFRDTFDDFRIDFEIFILHSLGEMDGGTRTLNGKTYFLFGIDGIVKYHTGESEAPFYHHEFFHMYHLQHFRGEERIWAALWAEGLATYVSEALNPGSSIQETGLDMPAGLIEQCEADLPFLWATLAAKLDSNSEEDYANFFLFGAKDPRIPKRAGYYLGYLLVKEMRQGRSLKELARLDGPALREEIIATIAKLAGR